MIEHQHKPKLPEREIPEEIRLAVLAAAGEARRLPCAEARALADKLGIDYAFLGYIFDTLDIRVTNCALGCF